MKKLFLSLSVAALLAPSVVVFANEVQSGSTDAQIVAALKDLAAKEEAAKAEAAKKAAEAKAAAEAAAAAEKEAIAKLEAKLGGSWVDPTSQTGNAQQAANEIKFQGADTSNVFPGTNGGADVVTTEAPATTTAAPAAKAPAAPAAKVAHKAVAAAKTATGVKTLPKTSAVK